MRVLVTGGTGFIGGYVVRKLIEKGHQVVIVTRNPGENRDTSNIRYISWDIDLVPIMSECAAVINLAGSNLFDERWSDRVKTRILKSRIDATFSVVDAISRADPKPRVLISGSAVGYYGTRGADKLDESQPPGNDFLSKVCVAWETEANKLDIPGVRVVTARIGIVQQKEDGALSKMLLPFKLYGGGPLGHGNQYYPWIHMDDVTGSIIHILENERISGAVNITSPEPVTMNEFASTLGKVMSRPSWFRVPEFILRAAVGETADAVLASLRVLPVKLLESGYQFRFRELEEALNDILKSR